MLSRSSCISEPVVDVTCHAVAANDSDAEAEVSRGGSEASGANRYHHHLLQLKAVIAKSTCCSFSVGWRKEYLRW